MKKRSIVGFKSLKVMQISDLHLGLTSIHERIQRVLEVTRTQKPDLLVVTGDLLDGPIRRELEIADFFKSIEAPLGKLFVLGNHEMYEGIEHAERFAKLAGLKLLRNETLKIGETLEVTGIDDPAFFERNGEETPRDLTLLPVLSENRARVFLKHRPVVEADALERFDVQLSGHSHSGQIFPFGYFTNLFSSHPCGLHEIGKAWFYHHPGSATWGPPLRFFSRPEVTLFHLTPCALDANTSGAD